MNFQEITEEEYNNHWENHPLKTFLSAKEISKLREKSNWNTYYVGVKENKTLIAAAMLLCHKRLFNRYEYYSPRGYLLDFNNEELLTFFTNELKKFIKAKKGYILRIDPYVIYKQRDINGNIVEGGIDNTKIVNNLIKLGYKKVPVKYKEQASWMFSLDLKGKSEEQILKEMSSNTRNTIRKTEKIGINIRELKYEELDKFQNIMEETSKRKGFSNRDLAYYQDMYQLFHNQNEIKYIITELNLKTYIKKLQTEKIEKEEKLESLSTAKYNDGVRKNILNEIESINRKIKESEDIIKEKKTDNIILSGSMFMLIKPEVVYLSSGNYEEFMKFNSQYLIQWELIKYGIENGFTKHNFYGIPENINTHPKDYGIYEFKKGFNGNVEELIGEYELPISWYYKIFNIMHKIKK